MTIEATGRTLVTRTLRLAALRIGLVSLCGGAISYFVNLWSIESSVREQLILSTAEVLLHESLKFGEIRDLQQNFLQEFQDIYAEPARRRDLARDFDLIFYRHADGSYTQRPGLFEGKALPDGRRFAKMSATYSPDIALDTDAKTRFALSYILSEKYGSAAEGRLFNFYGVVPEKGFPIYQSVDIAQAFTYSGPEALKLETYEFYYRGFDPATRDTIFTRMYWDYSNNAWMTTIATPGAMDASGRYRILACVDVLLDSLMQRMGNPTIQGSHTEIFQKDADGTLIFHPKYVEQIKTSAGAASIKSLKIEEEYSLLEMGRTFAPGKVGFTTTDQELVAFGGIPNTPWMFAMHYPKALMQPAIVQNLAIVVAIGLATLLVEILIIRGVLLKHVARPLGKLIRAMRQVGRSCAYLDETVLLAHSPDEIGQLAREFASMAGRVRDTHAQLERKVQERTAELEEANLKLVSISATDELTGIANRRRFDEVLSIEWKRAQRAGGSLAIAMIDVDWFKNYNDHYGHQAGDDCLRQVVEIFKSCGIRVSDLLARYGGEEFAIIMPDADADSAIHIVRRLCQAVQDAKLPHSASPYGCVTVSVGVAAASPVSGQPSGELVGEADQALYFAKQQGRNQAITLADASGVASSD